MDQPLKIFLPIVGVMVIFVIIMSIVRFTQNSNTKVKFNDFSSKLFKLEKGMTKETVISILGIQPDYRGENTLTYVKKLYGYGDLADHNTDKYVLYFNEYGAYQGYEKEHSYRKTRTY